MNRDFKKLILIISIMLIITMTACSSPKNEVVETNPVEEIKEEVPTKDANTGSLIDVSTDKKENVSPEMDAFLKMLTWDTSAADLKSYIKENIQYVSQEEAEKMIEFLLIYQTEAIEDFMITEDHFNEVYNHMNIAVIESISDKKLKASYKLLLDSSLILKFSEGYPYIDTDWESLREFSPYLHEDYDEVFDLYSKINSKAENLAYDPDEVDVLTPGDNIIKTETIVMNNDSSFLRKIANELYEAEIYNLMLGPEASHIYFWDEKDSEEYNDLMKLATKYPDSVFAKIINEIDNINIEEVSDVTKVIQKYTDFGLGSNKYMKTFNYNEGQGEYQIIQISIPEDKQKEDKVNNIIKMDIDKYIEEENIDGDFYISTDLKHADEQYISYEIYLEYKDWQGNEDSKYFYRTLDYLGEKYITLEEYLGKNFDLIKPDLERITGMELDTCPEFILYSDDISLFYMGEYGNEHIGSLNLKDLLLIMN